MADKAQHCTYNAMNAKAEILLVEYRYFFSVIGLFAILLLWRGVSLSTFAIPVGVWFAGVLLYANNPQWLAVLVLRCDPAFRHRRYDARRRH